MKINTWPLVQEQSHLILKEREKDEDMSSNLKTSRWGLKFISLGPFDAGNHFGRK